jgi:putative nucleotidyltransferase with HDIG domain
MKDKIREIYKSLPIAKDKHLCSVLKWAKKLSAEINLSHRDRLLVEYAVLLHDIGYKKIFDKEGNKIMEDKHELYSYEMADEYLEDTDLTNNEKILVKNAVLHHSEKDKCKTIYSKILWDSDKIDKSSFDGVLRKVIVFKSGYGIKTQEEIKEKIIRKLNGLKFFFDSTIKQHKRNMEYINNII